MLDFLICGAFSLACIICGIFTYKELKPKWLQLFVYFLAFSLVIEIAGFLYSAWFKKSNHFIFNFYILVENVFYYYLFSKVFIKKLFKQIAYACLSLFVLFYFYNILFVQQFLVFNTYSNLAGEILLSLCCLLCLIEFLMMDTPVNFFTIPMFWISTGILFFNIGNFLYLGFFDYIMQHNIDPLGHIYDVIFISLNFLQYSLFAIAFLCKRIWVNKKQFLY